MEHHFVCWNERKQTYVKEKIKWKKTNVCETKDQMKENKHMWNKRSYLQKRGDSHIIEFLFL